MASLVQVSVQTVQENAPVRKGVVDERVGNSLSAVLHHYCGILWKEFVVNKFHNMDMIQATQDLSFDAR